MHAGGVPILFCQSVGLAVMISRYILLAEVERLLGIKRMGKNSPQPPPTKESKLIKPWNMALVISRQLHLFKTA